MRALLAAGAALGLSACAVGVPERSVPAAVTALPPAYEQAEAPGTYQALEWWRSYEDPTLETLVRSAVRNNLDVAEAVARIEEVRARYARERAGLFPSLDASLEGNYVNQPATGIGAALGGAAMGADGGATDGGEGAVPPNAPDRFSFSTYAAQLQFSYEADFWGRIRSRGLAAAENHRASLSDLQTVRMSVASEVMRNYFDIVEAEQLLDINARQAAILQERVSLAEQAFLRGLATSFELISLRESRREAEAIGPQLEARSYASKTRLSVLLGTYPEETSEFLAEAGPLVVTLPMEAVPAGLPAQLLAQRPDVRAAFQRLDAARYGVAAARAARLPRLTFNAGGGLESDAPAGLVDPQNWFVNLLGALTAPLFDGGRLQANVDISEAQMRQQAFAYGQTVLTAFAEVESALKQHEAAIRRLQLLEADLQRAREASTLQLRRFERGTARYSDYLDSRFNVLGSHRSVVEAERNVAEARLAVHRSLGGAWLEDWIDDERMAQRE